MSIAIKSVKTKKDPYRYELVASDLRRDIKALESGEMLAPERDLAKHYSVSYMTMRRAVDILSHEGRLKRHQGRGTVVCDRLRTGEIAIVVRPKLLGVDSSPYFQSASNLLIEGVHKESSKWQIKLHVGRATQTGEDFPSTLDLLNAGMLSQLRGVFSFHRLFELLPKLEASNIPVVSMNIGRGFGEYQVGFDYSSVFTQAIEYLLKRGCHDIGFIGGGTGTYMGGSTDQTAFFAKILKENGLAYHEKWCCNGSSALLCESEGYEAFLRLWQQAERPRGILVSDDVICRGVLRAVLQLGIKLPDDLLLISHANQGINFPYHLPLTQVRFDISEQVDRAIEMMVKLVQGEVLPESERVVLLSGKLVKGKTA